MHQYPVSSNAWSGDWGLVLQGFEQVWLDTGDRKYLDYIKNNVDRFFAAEARGRTYRLEEYNLDDLGIGRALFRLYQETGDARYKQAIDLLIKQLKEQPRTSEGGFWHKKSCPFQMHLTDAYMVSSFYAQYASAFGEPAAFDDVGQQILLIERHTRDPKTGLFFSAWDESKMQEWADPQTGCSSQFSARAIGQYAMALVDVLDFLPASHQTRDRIITILARMIHSIALTQNQATGLWCHVLDGSGNDANELDAVASCMFVYAMTKGFRLGFLIGTSLAAAQKGFSGIVEHLTKCDETADVSSFAWRVGLPGDQARDRSRGLHVRQVPRTTDLTAVGAFILAISELSRLSSED